MNVSILVQIDKSILRNVLNNGLHPDSLENIVVMRVQHLLRRNKVPHGNIYKKVTRSDGTLFSLYQVMIVIENLVWDKYNLSKELIKSFSPYSDKLKKVNLVIN